MIGQNAFMGLALVVLASPCQAAIIYSQVPADSAVSYTSDFQASFINQQADNFTLSANETVTGVSVWGTYMDKPSILPTDSFTIRFFTTVSTDPNTPFFELTNVTPTFRVLTGFASPPPSLWPVYEYGFDLGGGVALTTSTEYWLSVVNSTSNANSWSWYRSSGGDNQRWRRSGDASSTVPWGTPTEHDLAFMLSNPPLAPQYAVPEPSTMALLGIAGLFGGLGALRRRVVGS